MRAIAITIIIARPVEEVFAFVSDATNNPLWQARCGLRQVQQEPDGLVGVGTRIAEVWSCLGRTIEAISEVTAYEPNRMYVRRALGEAGPIAVGDFTFEPIPEGTRWTAVAHFQARGFFALAELVLASTLKWRLADNMIQAKALIERGDEACVSST